VNPSQGATQRTGSAVVTCLVLCKREVGRKFGTATGGIVARADPMISEVGDGGWGRRRWG
jgi:hypothetical protein